jgi:hypothetical protein
MTDRMTLEPMTMDEDYPGDLDVDETESLIGNGWNWTCVFVDPEWDQVDEAEFLAMKADLGTPLVGFDSDDNGY